MIRTFRSKTADLDIYFKLNSNCFDMIKFTIVPRKVVVDARRKEKTSSIERDVPNSRSFEIYTNIPDDSPRTNCRTFMKVVSDTLAKGGGKELFSYNRKIDNTVVYFAFGLGDDNKHFNLGIWYGSDKKDTKLVYTFEDVEEINTILRLLDIFSDEKNQMFIHNVTDTILGAVRESVGQQLKYVINDMIQNAIHQN